MFYKVYEVTMMRAFYENNRKRLAGRLSEDSAAIVFSGKEVKKMGDENYPFTPNSNFFYLTGMEAPNEILLIMKKDGVTETMFIEPFDEVKAKWTGPVPLASEVTETSGVESVEYNYNFYEHLAGVLFDKRIENVYLDLENRVFHTVTQELDLAKEISEKYPHISVKNLHDEMAALRRIKQEYELDCLRRAIRITGEGVVNMMKNAAAGMYEYEIEAYFDYTLRSRGVKDFAFRSIVASGGNAAVLHYSKNCDKAADGSLVLCDVGAKYNLYSGDITRTFPVNGKFTARQKLLYDIVLDGQKLILDTIRPGIPFKSLNETLIKYYEDKLSEIGLITEPSQVRDVYWHGVSHMLGLETHDVGRHNEGLLEEGMVLTVEPGLYIADEGIGIRIEDDVVVTKDGCRILFDGIPKTTEEIEAVMCHG